jgi:hypothetical protein
MPGIADKFTQRAQSYCEWALPKQGGFGNPRLQASRFCAHIWRIVLVKSPGIAKSFGIAAIVVAIAAIIVPLYGLFLSAGAIVLAVIAALAGDRIYATATPVIAGVNTLFLSPLMWMLIADKGAKNVTSFYYFVIAFFVAPFVAMLLNARGKMVIR